MDTYEPKDIDGDDIEDILLQIEKSFNVTFSEKSFEHVMTFGEFVSAVEANIALEDVDSCTSQQAFYKIRTALEKIGLKEEVTLNLRLDLVFPRKKRRSKVQSFCANLGIGIRLLQPRNSLLVTNTILLLGGIITLFFEPFMAAGLIGFSILSYKILFHYANELRVNDIGELAKLLKQEKYALSRSSQTVNKKEIWTIVESYFEDYQLREKLKPESKFEWVK